MSTCSGSGISLHGDTDMKKKKKRVSDAGDGDDFEQTLSLSFTGMCFARHCVILTFKLTNAAPRRPPQTPMAMKMGTSQKYHQ